MRRRDHRPARGRAVIAVAALYALLLQAFLGFAAPTSARTEGGGVLCAEHGASAPTGGKADVSCHPCCTVLQVGTVAPPPLGAVAVTWPTASFARLVWRPEAARLGTGPPVHAASARGPPSA